MVAVHPGLLPTGSGLHAQALITHLSFATAGEVDRATYLSGGRPADGPRRTVILINDACTRFN